MRASQRYKHVKKPICLHPVPFSVENGAAVAHAEQMWAFLTHGFRGKDESIKTIKGMDMHLRKTNRTRKTIGSNSLSRSILCLSMTVQTVLEKNEHLCGHQLYARNLLY